MSCRCIHPVFQCSAITTRMKLNILEDLLHQELRSLYSAEKQTFEALTRMAEAACHPKLREIFMARMEDSGAQVRKLEHIAGRIGKKLEGSRCQGLRQLIEDEERESLLNARTRSETYDASLISSARNYIGYEIERYELAQMLASRLGHDEVEGLIRANLTVQKSLDGRLARLAKSLVNHRRVNADRAASAFRGASVAAMRLMCGSGLSASGF